MPHQLAEYRTACQVYGCSSRINPGVLTALRFGLPTLRVSGNFFDADCLALTEVWYSVKTCNIDNVKAKGKASHSNLYRFSCITATVLYDT